MRRLYGGASASDFGPKKLKAIRRQLIEDGLSRGVVNTRVGQIKRPFQWAVAEELAPPAVYRGLQAVAGLSFGRSSARVTEPVRPVPDLYVAAVLPFVSPHVAAMIKLQRVTGMRPGELVIMRPCDIDMTGDVWIYSPFDHKNRWRGHRKQIPQQDRCRAGRSSTSHLGRGATWAPAGCCGCSANCGRAGSDGGRPAPQRSIAE